MPEMTAELSPPPKEVTFIYTARVFCDNCGWDGTVEIPKGAMVTAHPCPYCGCERLRRELA